MIKIKVNRNDINGGERNNCYNCPVALAIRRTTNTLPKVYVCSVEIKERSITLPVEVQSFIYSFDHGESVEPFTFILNYDL